MEKYLYKVNLIQYRREINHKIGELCWYGIDYHLNELGMYIEDHEEFLIDNGYIHNTDYEELRFLFK